MADQFGPNSEKKSKHGCTNVSRSKIIQWAKSLSGAEELGFSSHDFTNYPTLTEVKDVTLTYKMTHINTHTQMDVKNADEKYQLHLKKCIFSLQ